MLIGGWIGVRPRGSPLRQPLPARPEPVIVGCCGFGNAADVIQQTGVADLFAPQLTQYPFGVHIFLKRLVNQLCRGVVGPKDRPCFVSGYGNSQETRLWDSES